MKSWLVLLLVIPFACTPEVEKQAPRSYVTRMSIASGQESVLECETGRWRGRITIAADVEVGYRNVTTTGSGGPDSKTTLTLDDVLMTIEPEGLLFGADTRVQLDGEVAVVVRKDGILVNSAHVADLPAK